jgi:hypothetical protein
MQRTSDPAAAQPARGASRTVTLLAVLAGLLMIGLAGALAFFILRPGQPAAAPPVPAQPVAEQPAAASPPPSEQPVPAPAEEEPTEEEPIEAEPGAVQDQPDDQSQTFVFELGDAQEEGETGATTPAAASKRARAVRRRIKKSKPAGKKAAVAEKTATPAGGGDDLLAAVTQPDGEKTQTAKSDDDPFAEPIGGKKSEPAEPSAEAAPEPEKAKPPPPDPNRSIDDLLNSAISDKKKKAAKPPAAEKPATAALPAEPSRAQILSGIRGVLPSAKACGQGKGGTAQARITVSGNTGRVSNVTVTGVDTAVGNCISNALRRARFPKFSKPTFNISYPISL